MSGTRPAGTLVLLRTGARTPPGVLTWDAWSALRAAGEVLTAHDPGPQWDEALAAAGVSLVRVDGVPAAERAQDLLARACEGTVVWWLDPLADDEAAQALARDLVARPGPATPVVEMVLGSWDPAGAAVLELVEVMDRLRSPGGCPWDAEQTPRSLVPYVLEETHELIEAIESEDRDATVEELGDLLLQVVFQARVGQERDDLPFDVDEVAAGIIAKLRRRHPHVFGDQQVRSAEDVSVLWEQVKQQEKGRASVLDGVPAMLPALARAQKVLARLDRADLPVETPGDSLGTRLVELVREAAAAGLDAEAELRGSVRAIEDSAREREV